LINQADKLGASDILIENQLTHFRIGVHINGGLIQSDLKSECYRMAIGTLDSRANISTAATEP